MCVCVREREREREKDLLACRFSGYEKEVVILSKKTEDSPYTSFMGKGVIGLPPQTVFDSIRNPQLRFTYDNMLKVNSSWRVCVCVCV